MTKAIYLSAREAAETLGVSRATLYAYVSRGLVRSEAVGEEPRRRRYHAEDIQRLKKRKDLRRNPAQTTEQALSWGLPVLESGLTLIADGHLYYRGQDAIELALNSSLEEVARLLWAAAAGTEQTSQAEEPTPSFPLPVLQSERLAPVSAFQAALLQAESQDAAAFDLRPESIARKGFLILNRLVGLAAQAETSGSASVTQTLQASWAPARPETRRLLNAALVLCADHELNVSAFTVRCVASAGASPYAAVIAGLSALQGVKHGGTSRRVQALFQEVERPERAQAVLSSRLARGETIPGFGHPIYPQGDPRARLLLELLRPISSPHQLELANAIIQAAQELIGELPTLDFALVCLARGLELPEGAALIIFALGRTVGWIAHAIEQYRSNSLIRPRARYTGPQPERNEGATKHY